MSIYYYITLYWGLTLDSKQLDIVPIEIRNILCLQIKLYADNATPLSDFYHWQFIPVLNKTKQNKIVDDFHMYSKIIKRMKL